MNVPFASDDPATGSFDYVSKNPLGMSQYDLMRSGAQSPRNSDQGDGDRVGVESFPEIDAWLVSWL